jgi:hypothetical protein
MRILLGVVLIIIAVLLLVGWIVIPVIPQTADNTTIDGLLAQVLCQPNDTVIREQYSRRDYDGTSYSMDIYCQNSERQREDVTGKWAILGAGLFTVPFLIGLFMIIFSSIRNGVRMQQTALGNVFMVDTGKLKNSDNANSWVVSSYSDKIKTSDFGFSDGKFRMGGIEINMGLSPEHEKMIQEATNKSSTLKDTLQQLQEAYDAGLLQEDEYQRLRQEAMDRFI